MAKGTELLGVLAADGSQAYRAGYVVGRLLVIGLVVAAIVALVRAVRKTSPTGDYGGPSTGGPYTGWPDAVGPTPPGAPGGPPAGWHPDPAGGPFLRWWDGTQWTDQTSGRPPG